MNVLELAQQMEERFCNPLYGKPTYDLIIMAVQALRVQHEMLERLKETYGTKTTSE